MYQPKGGSLPSSPGGFWLHPLPLQTSLLHCSLLRVLGSCVCRCCCLGFWRPARTRFLPQAAPASQSCLCLPFVGLTTFLPFVPATVVVEGTLEGEPVMSPLRCSSHGLGCSWSLEV